jgi:signal peptidase I
MPDRNPDTEKNRKFPRTVEQMELQKQLDWQNSEAQRLKEEEEKAAEKAKKPALRFAVSSRFMHVFIWFMGILLTVLIAFFSVRMFCREVEIADSSMEPTLSNGEVWLINRMAYRIGTPQRGDIIVFRTESDNGSSLHVKRVIGLPGETVQISNGQMLINGETYKGDEFPSVLDPGLAADPVTLTEGEYFVLGDNRNGSEDSRYASVGNVDESMIVGSIWFCVHPVGKIGFAPS